MANGKVVSGDYAGKTIEAGYGALFIKLGWGLHDVLNLNKNTITSYELITEEHSKSAKSGIIRGSIGSILGPVGLIAGALSAKNKGNYLVAVAFKSGKQSLIEMDSKAYRLLISRMFNPTQNTASSNLQQNNDFKQQDSTELYHNKSSSLSIRNNAPKAVISNTSREQNVDEVSTPIANNTQSEINQSEANNYLNKSTAIMLCLFLGFFGMHKIYEKKYLPAILYMMTFGFFGIAVIYDLIVLIGKPSKYKI